MITSNLEAEIWCGGSPTIYRRDSPSHYRIHDRSFRQMAYFSSLLMITSSLGAEIWCGDSPTIIKVMAEFYVISTWNYHIIFIYIFPLFSL